MKKFIFLLFLLLFVTLIYPKIKKTNNSQTITPSPSQNPSPQTKTSQEILINSKTYIIISQKISGDILLTPNLAPPKTSSTLIEENNCKYAFSSAFYLENNNPLGFYISKKYTNTNINSASWFNGFVSINNNQIEISNSQPQNAEFAFQSGPLYPNNLKLNSDQTDRRIILTKENEDIFISVVHTKESVFDGPSLAQIWDIITKTRPNAKKALNLDGGSASLFYTPENNLSELTPIGSLLCIK